MEITQIEPDVARFRGAIGQIRQRGVPGTVLHDLNVELDFLSSARGSTVYTMAAAYTYILMREMELQILMALLHSDAFISALNHKEIFYLRNMNDALMATIGNVLTAMNFNADYDAWLATLDRHRYEFENTLFIQHYIKETKRISDGRATFLQKQRILIPVKIRILSLEVV